MIRLTFLAALLALPAAAQAPPADNCGVRIKVEYKLANEFLESPMVRWLDGGGMMEFWGNPNTGTWTLLRTKPGGPVCVVADGIGFEGIFAYEPKPGDPA